MRSRLPVPGADQSPAGRVARESAYQTSTSTCPVTLKAGLAAPCGISRPGSGVLARAAARGHMKGPACYRMVQAAQGGFGPTEREPALALGDTDLRTVPAWWDRRRLRGAGLWAAAFV